MLFILFSLLFLPSIYQFSRQLTLPNTPTVLKKKNKVVSACSLQELVLHTYVYVCMHICYRLGITSNTCRQGSIRFVSCILKSQPFLKQKRVFLDRFYVFGFVCAFSLLKSIALMQFQAFLYLACLCIQSLYKSSANVYFILLGLASSPYKWLM